MARKIARQAVMQLLYERACGGDCDDDSISLVYEQLSLAQNKAPGKLRPTDDDARYIDDVLRGVYEHQPDIDARIERFSQEWTIDRMPRVDLSILRLCAYELFYRDDVPDNVAISEAMELAGKYSEPKSGRFINGVLGAIERQKQLE